VSLVLHLVLLLLLLLLLLLCRPRAQQLPSRRWT
jgi:hypothetical protein